MKPKSCEEIIVLWLESKIGRLVCYTMLTNEFNNFARQYGEFYSYTTIIPKMRKVKREKYLLHRAGIRLVQANIPKEKQTYWEVEKCDKSFLSDSDRPKRKYTLKEKEAVKHAMKRDLSEIKSIIELVDSKCNKDGQFEL